MPVNQSIYRPAGDPVRGNALFLILIAVALFAALSYAITQSGRGGGNIDKETMLIKMTQITQHADDVRNTFTRMVLTGTAASAITFDDTSETGIFAADGGGASDEAPPDGIAETSSGVMGTNLAWNTWGYTGLGNSGNYITDIGKNTNVTGRDAIAFMLYLSESACEQINKNLGLDPTPATQQGWQAYMQAGNMPDYTLDYNVLSAYPGQEFACANIHSGPFAVADMKLYYHAIYTQ